jgi:SAM-dependent methyltransferase
MKPEELKVVVQEKYAQIASQSKEQNQSSCCGSTSCCDKSNYTIFSDDYSNLKGYNPDADLGLGCGLPTEYAGIETGHHVLDLGSGAGNDCFVARSIVGEEGKVVGIDFTDEMLKKANDNAKKLGYSNVSFLKGDIEDMPIDNNSFDVVISNCVLNLVPDKKKAFSEIFRVLKPGAHFSVSDVVLVGNLPAELQESAEMYAGCVSGAIQKEEYLNIIKESGFSSIEINKEKQIDVPRNILLEYLNEDALKIYDESKVGIFSITVKGVK